MKRYFEITINSVGPDSPGRADYAGFTNDDAVGSDTTYSGGYYAFTRDSIPAPKAFLTQTGGDNQGTMPLVSNGDVLCFAIDDVALLWWTTIAGGQWNNDGAADPATGTGGIAFSTPNDPPDHIMGGINSGAGSGTTEQTMNAGASSFTGTIPAGFSAWDTSGDTTWDLGWAGPAGSNRAYSNGNLTVSSDNSGGTINWRSGVPSPAGGRRPASVRMVP